MHSGWLSRQAVERMRMFGKLKMASQHVAVFSWLVTMIVLRPTLTQNVLDNGNPVSVTKPAISTMSPPLPQTTKALTEVGSSLPSTALPVDEGDNCTRAPPAEPVLAPPNTGRSSPQSLLYIKLMDEYGPRTLRPVRNQSEQIQVALGARPAALITLEEREQTISLQLSMTMIWKDESLVWDPADHEGVTLLTVDVDHIWAPDIILQESIGETFDEVNNGYATVTYEGVVTWYDMVTTTTFCKLLIRYFPFDVQHCSLSFTSWNYDRSEIDFFYENAYTFEEQLEKFVKNGLWSLTEIEVSHINHTFGCDEDECLDWPSIKYVLELSRTQSNFYAMNILLPCILLSLMNLLVFVLPTEAGEKISFVMTNVLALVLFQQMVASMLPPSGDDTPIFSIHVFWMIVFGTIAITWTVIVIVVYFERKYYPKRLFRFLTSFKCMYYNLRFGRKEAGTRKYVNLARSRQVLDDLIKEAEGEDIPLGEMGGSAKYRNGSAKVKVDTVERWTDDGIKIYRADKSSLPVDASDDHLDEEPPPPSTIKQRIKMVFCGHCGQLNAAKLRLKDENFTFDPEDERLWQETAVLLDKLMAYLMVFMTTAVYFVLLIRFATHDPHEYRASTE